MILILNYVWQQKVICLLLFGCSLLKFTILKLVNQTCLEFHFIDLVWFLFFVIFKAMLLIRQIDCIFYWLTWNKKKIQSFTVLFLDLHCLLVISDRYCQQYIAFVNLCRPGLIQAKIKGLESWRHSIY